MDRLLRLCIVFLLGFTVSSCATRPDAESPRVVAGHMVLVQRWFPASEDGYTQIEFPLLIAKEPGYNGWTYWGNQFWIQDGDIGYAGLQANSKNEKRINFAIWKALRWQLPGSGVNCSFFNHEGSGVQCWVAYPWKAGVKYTFILKRIGIGSFQLSVRDESNGALKNVAIIQTSTTWGKLKRETMAFLEHFAQGNEQPSSCSEVPGTSAVFFAPLANGEIPTETSSSYPYGPCKAIARTTCTTQHDCLASANLFGREQFRSQHVTSGHCLDLSAGGVEAKLGECGTSADQLLDRTDNFALQLRNGARCLQASPGGQVKAVECASDSAQAWLPVSGTNAVYNPGTDQCLRVAEGGEPGTAIVTGSCIGAPRWTDLP